MCWPFLTRAEPRSFCRKLRGANQLNYFRKQDTINPNKNNTKQKTKLKTTLFAAIKTKQK